MLQTLADNRPLPGLELVIGTDLARRDVLGEVLGSGQVLAEERAGRLHRLARGIVHLLPGALPLEDQVADQHAGDRAVGDALAGIAGDDEGALFAGVEADEGAIVDRILDLPGPAMHFLAKLREQIAHPGFEREEARVSIVGLAGFVVGAADDQDVVLAACPAAGARSDRPRAYPSRARRAVRPWAARTPSHRCDRAPAWYGWRICR